jgi:hypothetical protein
MGWWLGVLGASMLITVNNLLLRAIGFRPRVVLLLLPLLVGAQLGYSYAYGHAPKFVQAWFLGTAALAVLGLTASYLMGRTLGLRDLIGVGCIALGSYLLLR